MNGVADKFIDDIAEEYVEGDIRGKVGQINIPLAISTTAVMIAMIIWVLVDAEGMQTFLKGAMSNISRYFGWLFIGVTGLCVFILLWFSSSKFGDLKLGKPDEKPAFSTFAWISMIFCCTNASAIIIWAVAEPLFHMATPPLGAEPGSYQAMRDAFAVSIWHSGLAGWAIFAVGAACMGIPAFRKNLPLNFATAFYPIWREKVYRGFLGGFLETLGVLSSVMGIGTSVGLGLVMFNFGFKHLFNIELGNIGMLCIIIVVSILFTLSVMFGIEKGIKRLSVFTVYLALAIWAYLLMAGPTREILNWIPQIIGDTLATVPQLIFHTDAGDAIAEGKWMSWWTVFWMAWWIAWIPFACGFYATISRGRTLRELFLAGTFIPFLAWCIWDAAMSTTAVHVDKLTEGALTAAINADAGAGFFVMADSLPGGYLVSLVIIFMLICWQVTSADSASYFVAMQLTHGHLEPQKRIRIISGVSIACTALILQLVGGLRAVQTASIIAGLPMSFLTIIMIYGLYKFCKAELAASGYTKQYY